MPDPLMSDRAPSATETRPRDRGAGGFRADGSRASGTHTDGVLSPASLTALELTSLLRVVAALAATDLGTERVLALAPTRDRDELQRRRQRYEEAQRLLGERRLIGAFEQPLAPLLERLASDRPPFDGAGLLEISALLRATAEARDRIRQADPPAPALAELAGVADAAASAAAGAGTADTAFADEEQLRRRIDKTLDRRGRVRDDASPRLVALRGRIRTARDQIYRDLKTVVEGQREYLSEDTIPMRDGRLVLMLSSGARGRLPGLVHGRSGTGRSFYFEPLTVVEANNTLQEAVEEEDAERARILAELVTEARRLEPEIRSQALLLAELDLLQAAVGFGAAAAARLADLAPDGQVVLRGARHPLLDPKLAALRERALGGAGHDAPIEPLDLRLGGAGGDKGGVKGDGDEGEAARVLVVTGPNAGGKTVSLKTLGLLAAAHQCGLPVPAEAGSRLPLFGRMVAAIGDEQDLMTDRSTFSGRLLRLDEAWRDAGPHSLILLDELGSGTDPEEGSALAVALLEELLAKGGLGLITTHLTPLAAAALELPGAACAAMEFDAETGAPTYRLMPGPPGGSEALALARRLGLPSEWLDRAEAKLGAERRDLRRLLAEVEELRQQLQRERGELEAQKNDAELLRSRLAEQEQALIDERRKVGKRLTAELEVFRRETRGRLREEVERITTAVEAGRRKGLATEAEGRLFAAAPDLPDAEPEPESAPIELGGAVRHLQLGWQGVLEKLDGDKAEVSVRGKKLRCRIGELAGVVAQGRGAGKPATAASAKKGRRGSVSRSGQGTSDLGLEDSAASEINLIGQRVEPALTALDSYLDQALLSPHRAVRIIHGHGSGRLRQAVRSHLDQHPAVGSFRPGDDKEGGDGATVVALRGA
jgi:DNA mismatch repair protein MutS2